MNELDEMWAKMLSHALDNARAAGRHDVADYLNLKAANDTIRRASVKWLFDTLLEIAGNATRQNLSITIERNDPHNFAHRGANLVGSLVRFRYGVRCLTLEAGWTRTPSDGFMRGGALAFARITHWGIPKANTEIALWVENERPAWKLMAEENPSEVLRSEVLHEHFRILTGA